MLPKIIILLHIVYYKHLLLPKIISWAPLDCSQSFHSASKIPALSPVVLAHKCLWHFLGSGQHRTGFLKAEQPLKPALSAAGPLCPSAPTPILFLQGFYRAELSCDLGVKPGVGCSSWFLMEWRHQRSRVCSGILGKSQKFLLLSAPGHPWDQAFGEAASHPAAAIPKGNSAREGWEVGVWKPKSS